MKKIVVGLLLLTGIFSYANDYELGDGIALTDNIHLSGYISTEYEALNSHNKFILDDFALLIYGNILPKLSYFAEVEGSSIYIKDFQTKNESTNTTPHIERLYMDYSLAENYHIRVGKQITPIGYWNFEPINVLRDTTSNPLYSFSMFPKLLTGLDFYLKTSGNEHLSYHVFMQNNDGISDKEANIKSKYFVGLSLTYDFDMESNIGGSIGRYEPSKRKSTTVDYVQFNAKYHHNIYDFQTEFIYTKTEESQHKKTNELVGYIQGKYNLNEQHAFIGRYEYIEKETISNLAVIGYSYRPIPPVSFKMEYQFHEKQAHNNLLMSLSLLF